MFIVRTLRAKTLRSNWRKEKSFSSEGPGWRRIRLDSKVTRIPSHAHLQLRWWRLLGWILRLVLTWIHLTQKVYKWDKILWLLHLLKAKSKQPSCSQVSAQPKSTKNSKINTACWSKSKTSTSSSFRPWKTCNSKKKTIRNGETMRKSSPNCSRTSKQRFYHQEWRCLMTRSFWAKFKKM